MIAVDYSDLQPQWTAESFSEPVDASALDLGYEVAFPFLAAPSAEADQH